MLLDLLVISLQETGLLCHSHLHVVHPVFMNEVLMIEHSSIITASNVEEMPMPIFSLFFVFMHSVHKVHKMNALRGGVYKHVSTLKLMYGS
jgi:hypothetical protein